MEQTDNSAGHWDHFLSTMRSWRMESSIDDLLERILRDTVTLLRLDRGVVYLLGMDGLHASTFYPDKSPELSAASQAIASQVTERGRPLFAHALPDDPAVTHVSGPRAELTCCLPLSSGSGVLGALYLDSLDPKRSLSAGEQGQLESLGLQVAATLENAILYQRAITDPLTGLYTHRHFQHELEQCVRRAQRNQRPLSLAIIDLDHFKQLNDSAGHDAGNQYLLAVAQLLQESLRRTDVVARFGGDEFELALPDTAPEQAVQVVEKLRQRIGTLPCPVPVTASIGIASYPLQAADADALFICADDALYQAKHAGRNGVVLSNRIVSPQSLGGRKATTAAVTPMAVTTAAWTQVVVAAAVPRAEVPVRSTGGAVRETIDGYPVIRRLGVGSTSEVFLVQQPELNREVALKRPLTPHLTSEQSAAFEAEAQLTAGLSHPGVVPVHTLGRDADGRQYFTMKPLEGQSLGEMMRTTGGVARATPGRLVEMLQRVAEALAYAHLRGIAHLDLTPANIVVGRFGEVNVIDWGRGSSGADNGSTPAPGPFSEAILPGMVSGNPAYLAPEQLPQHHTPPGPPTDIYALGCILYEILTGRPPFVRESTRQVLAALMRGELPPAPEQLVPEKGIDPAVSALCLAALNPDPEKRPDATVFADTLGRAIRGEAAWEKISFGPQAHPVVESEWRSATGCWRLVDGGWKAMAAGENMLFLHLPINPPLRFVCEAWSDSGTELALQVGASEKNRYQGYCFEVGADGNTGSKLALNASDVLFDLSLRVEPGRHYRLEVEYADGWVACLLDGRCIFRYRELYATRGQLLGFYTFEPGAHFRPLEINWRPEGMHISRMQDADEHFERGEFTAALAGYTAIAAKFPQLLAGAEARLKSGKCLFSLREPAQALERLQSLAGTALEPNAVVEQALNWLGHGEIDRALAALQSLVARYPADHVRVAIADVARLFKNRDIPGYATTVSRQARLAMQRLVVEVFPIRSDAHRKAVALVVTLLQQLGRYPEALGFIQNLWETQLDASSRNFDGYAASRLYAILSCGRFDLLPAPPALPWILKFGSDHSDCVPIRLAVPDGPFPAEPPPAEWSWILSAALNGFGGEWRAAMLYFLVLKQTAAAQSLFTHLFAPPVNGSGWSARDCAVAGGNFVADTLDESLLTAYTVSATAMLERLGEGVGYESYMLYLRARLKFQAGDWDTAKALLGQCDPQRFNTAALGGLYWLLAGIFELHPAGEVDAHLSGSMADLAAISRGSMSLDAVANWPYHAYYPQCRLWLALVLERRGDTARARDLALQINEPRYGLTQCQPGIERLLQRLNRDCNKGE